MVPVAQVQKAIAAFLDKEVCPKLVGRDKWVVSGIATMYLPKITALADANGNIDIYNLIEGVRPAARQSPAEFNIPFGGKIKLTEADLDKLKEYIAIS